MGSTSTAMGPGAHLGAWALKAANRSSGSWVTTTDRFTAGGRNMKVGGKLAAALVVATGLIVPATANAAISAKVTDDAGNPVQLAPGAPPALKSMDVRALVNASEGKGFSSSVIGPDNQPTGISVGCGLPGTERTNYVDYHGNGTYTLTV